LSPGCCSCCCCCVHSLGGLAGAVYGSLRRDKPLPESLSTEQAISAESEIDRASRYAVRVYWLALTLCAFLTVAICTIVNPREAVVGPALIAGLLPVGQLAASIFSWIYIAMRPPLRRAVCLPRLGRLTLLAFLCC